MADTEWINSQQEGGGQRRSRNSSTSPRHSSLTMSNGTSPPVPTPPDTTTTTTPPVPMRQLEFTQAMNDFHNMFPSMDREVIEAVLRANNGIVDATIDQLLTMSIDNNEDDDDLPDHILLSVQRDVALETGGQNMKKSPNLRNVKPDESVEESPPSYTEAIKSPHVMTATHRHLHHHPAHRLSQTSPQRTSPRHHPHHSPPPAAANLLDLETDELALSNTEVKSHQPSWESSNAASLLSSADMADSAAVAWGRGETNSLHSTHSKRSALKASSRQHGRFSPSSGTEGCPASHRSPQQRKVSWDTAPLPTRSKSFGGADGKRGHCHHHHQRQGSGGGGSPAKLPPYKNWNPPLLGTLPDDFLRLVPRLPQRVPLMTQKSDPGHRRSASSGLQRSLSSCEAPTETAGHRRSQSHHLPARTMSFAGQSSRSAQSQRIITQDISTDLIQMRMRENERRRRQASVELDPDLAQYLEDERLALILQNSEFLQELRDDEDFMRTLERDRQASTMEAAPAVEAKPPLSPPAVNPEEHEGYGQDHQDTLEAFPFSQQLPKAKSQDDAELLHKLKHMGKASKKQFAALARRFFSRKRRKSPRQLFRETLAPSMTNLLDEEEEDNDEDDHVLGSSPSAHTASPAAGRSGFRVDGLPPRSNLDIV